MRRSRRPLVVGLVVIAVAIVGIVRAQDRDRTDQYEFAAVFDTAKGMVPGQLVKVAGVRVGTLTAVRLTANRKALMVLRVDEASGPFHQDASCRILPEGFISESFVDCVPGTPGAGPLRASEASGGLPTVPVSRTTVPVALQDVVDTVAAPTADRIRVLFNELGIATAGRGDDINAILRRANPSLRQARELLTILDAQRDSIASAVGDTDRVIARLRTDRRAIRSVLDRAATVSTATARQDRALAAGIRRLPRTLDAVDSGLSSLNRASDTLIPFARNLRRTAPSLDQLTRAIPPLSRTGTPALRRLASAAGRGRSSVRAATPVVRDVENTAARAAPVLHQTRRLLVDSREQGALEHVQRLLYSLSTVTATRDSISHVVSIFAGVYPKCIVSRASAGCRHTYDAPGRGTVPLNEPERGDTSAEPRTVARATSRLRPISPDRSVTP